VWGFASGGGEKSRRLKAAGGVGGGAAWLTQVHGRNVVDLDCRKDETVGQADHDAAAAGNCVSGRTRRLGALGPGGCGVHPAAGRVCAILTADCLPIMLAADSGT